MGQSVLAHHASRALAVTFAALAAIGSTAAARAQEAPPRVIAVTGQGEVETTPDLATITAGVATEAATAAAALAGTAQAMTEVLSAVEAAGIAPADVQTSRLSLDPVWSEPPVAPREGQPSLPRVAGYRAGNTVTLRVRDVDRLGEVIDAVGRAGANQLYGIGFSLDDPSEALDRAREAAVADALSKAELFARAAGVTLGPLRSLRETVSGPERMPLGARAEMAMDMPVAEGSVAVGASVEMIFGLD